MKLTKPSAWSLSMRVAFAAAMLSVITLIMASLVGVWALAYQLQTNTYNELMAKRALFNHILSEIPNLAALDDHRHRFDDILAGHPELHAGLFELEGEVLRFAFSDEGRRALSNPQNASALRNAQALVSPDLLSSPIRLTEPLLATGQATLADQSPVRTVLIQGRSSDAKLLQTYVNAVLLSVPIALVLAALGAWAIARIGLRPLGRFSKLVGSVGTSTLNTRVKLDQLPAELRALAIAFNDMLARIDSTLTRLTQFSDEVAHELRTPVSIVLGRTQVALSKTRDVDSLRNTLAENIEEMERLSRLISDMLFLAQADNGTYLLETEQVSLADESRIVVEFLSFLAEERALRVEVIGTASATVNRSLFRRAVTNLLSNAIRHAAKGTSIAITLSETSSGVDVSVSNFGSAIAAADTAKVFERFFRVEGHRSRETGGSGLGLAIVRSIMQLHGGSASVRSERDNAVTFVLHFPSIVQSRSS